MKKPYTARIHVGGGKYQWIGRFATRRERDLAKAKARVELEDARDVSKLTVDEWAARFLARYAKRNKASSHATATQALKQFRSEMGGRPLVTITRLDAMDWVESEKPGAGVLVTLFAAAVDAELLDRNPFRALGPRTKGRSEQPPPTEEQLAKLVDACTALGWYAPQMRALLTFAAYTGMRPGEIYALEWDDIDMKAMRIRVERRLWQGELDTPKNNKPKLISLTPPARDALLGLASRSEGGLVFRSKMGKRLSQATLSGYWGQVTARAGLEFEFYLATKHFCVHYLWTKLNLSTRAIAAQMGWSVATVDKMLAIYGHGEIGALEEVDAAFASAKVVPIRDASQTQDGGQGA